MGQWFVQVWHGLRRRLWLATALGVLLALTATFFALDWWAQSRYREAEQLLREERFAEARTYVEECQRVWWWKTGGTLLLAARLERLLGNFPEGVKLLEKSVSLSGKTTESAHLEATLFRADQGVLNEEEEKKLWEQVEKKHPDSPQILRSLAIVYFNRWLYIQAMEALDLWVALSPRSSEALDRRGQLWERLNNYAEAEKDYRKALTLTPTQSKIRFRLVVVLLRHNGNPADILEQLNQLLEEAPTRPEYLVSLARYQMLKGDFPAARQLFDQVLQLDAANANVFRYRAELELQAKQFAVAETWARKAMAKEPVNQEAMLLLVESLKRQNGVQKQQEAELQEKKYYAAKADTKRLSELLSRDKKELESPEVLVEIGEILLRAQQKEASNLFLKKALARNPNHAGAKALQAKLQK